MLILAASDIHGNYRVYERIVEDAQTRKVEAVILAGDLLGFLGDSEDLQESQRASAHRVVSILKKLEVPVLFIMGNDDWVDLLDSTDAQITSIHGRRVELGEFNFVGYQYTLPFMGGINERPENTIAADLVMLEREMDEDTIFVTHNPAKGILDKTRLGLAGSPSIRDTVESRNVRAHIHGHIHGFFGRAGRHFNVASGYKMRFMIIDLASMNHEVIDESDKQ